MIPLRAAGALILALVVAACSSGGLGTPKDSPFAPPVAANQNAVDGLLVGHRLMASGEFELALDAFYRAAGSQGLTAEILSSIGTANLALGRLGQAEENLKDALDLDETAPSIWNNLGVIMLEKGETGEAVQIFKKAYALDHGESDSIRDNLRLALAKLEKAPYDPKITQEYKLVRRGDSDYMIQLTP